MSGEFLTTELKLVQKDVRFDQTKQDNKMILTLTVEIIKQKRKMQFYDLLTSTDNMN